MLVPPILMILILDRDLLSLHDPAALAREARLVLLARRRRAVVAPPAARDRRDGVDVVAHLGVVRGRAGARARRVGEVVALRRGLDVADEDAEDGDAGGDDCHAGLGVAPDVEVDGGAWRKKVRVSNGVCLKEGVENVLGVLAYLGWGTAWPGSWLSLRWR